MSIFNNEKPTLPIPNYEYITSADQVGPIVSELFNHPEIEVDTETTGLDPFTSKPVLLQIGTLNKAYVFDVRHDTVHSDIHMEQFEPIMVEPTVNKILQNAVFDMKVFKVNGGYYLKNIYDTMLAEQLINLGLMMRGAGLADIINKYLGLSMDKEPRGTFQDYNQTFEPYQLDYAAKDVSVLTLIKDLQRPALEENGLLDVADLEFAFTKPMCEMELNGINIDDVKWRKMFKDIGNECNAARDDLLNMLSKSYGQNVMFGLPVINIDSNKQLLKALHDQGIDIPSTDAKVVSKYKKLPVIAQLMAYRKLNKLISTYGESLLEKVNPVTGRLHTSFQQLVSTGRMSSRAPNIQNIPKQQRYRSCFVAQKGYTLITADMASAELRILGNLSEDPVFLECFNKGIDLHSRSASEIFGVPISEVDHKMRNACKALSFGLVYGMSKYGLAARLDIKEKEAEKLINNYFNVFKDVKKFLDKSAADGVRLGYTTTVSGRRRFYKIPPFGHPDRSRVQKMVERQAKNAGIQGCLLANTKVKSVGDIGNQVNKSIKLETGFGDDTAVGVYSGCKDAYSLKLSNGIDLGITLEHKIPTVNKLGKLYTSKDTPVEDITENDLIMVPLNVVEGQVKNISGYEYKKSHWRETYVDYKLPEKMNDRLSFVIGCLIGDGTYTMHNHFRFVCPTSQKELFNKFNGYVEELFNYKPVVKYAHINDVTREPLPFSQVSSVVIRGFLKHIGLDYVKHHDKTVPDYFYTETIENRGALLNGLFSTDGGFTKKSGANYTTVSKDLANMIHQLLFTLGINSNLKTYSEEKGEVYRLQIPKRFNSKFKKYIGFSVNSKQELLNANCYPPKFGDDSVVPEFIPMTIENVLRRSATFFTDFSTQEKAHLRRFKVGKCSFSSWRKFYNLLPECSEKKLLSKYLNFDFCTKKSLTYIGQRDTYDLMCNDVHYFTANGIICHNSNADTIKAGMVKIVDRLEESNLDAKILLTVHDEVVIEVINGQEEAAADIVAQSIIDGFGDYFTKIKMETQPLFGPSWLKHQCEAKLEDGTECGCPTMVFVEDETYGTKLVCSSCGAGQE